MSNVIWGFVGGIGFVVLVVVVAEKYDEWVFALQKCRNGTRGCWGRCAKCIRERIKQEGEPKL